MTIIENALLVDGCLYDADGAFAAHAREDVPALLAEVARLRAENERLRAERKRLHEQLGRAAISFEQCDSDRRSFADHCTRLRIALENYGKMENWRVTPPDAASQQHLQWAGMTDPIADAVHLLRSLDAAVQEDA